jgi:type IV secretion system protein VirD4
MTRKPRHFHLKPKHFLVAGATVYVAAAFYAGLYLAGWLFFLFIKTMPESVDSGTFAALWQQLASVPAHRKKLQAAGVIAAALVYLAPLLAVTALTRRERALHGAARFAYAREVRQADLRAEKGIIIGQYGGEYLSFGGQQFVLLAAPTRSGKGVGVVIPNCLNWPDSAVVLDLKLENFRVTSGFRAKHGQEVFLFAPFSDEFRTHRWNPLSAVSRDPNFRVGDIQAIAATFYPSGTGASSSNEAFFNDQAQNLFLGLVLYLIETPSLPCTLGEVLRQGSGKGRAVDQHLRAILAERSTGPNALSPTCVNALNRFLSNSENVIANIKASFDAPLLIFDNPIVDAATSGDDFDLRDLRRKRMTIYLGFEPRKLESASRLVNVFFSQLINLNTDKLPDDDARLKYQCLLVMDEFTGIGRIPILAKSVAYIAGYGLRLLIIIQSIEQLEDPRVYGKEGARNIVKNHDLKIVFPPDDIEDAEKVSRTLGYLTEKATSKGESRATGWGRGASASRSENVSDQRRALLLPQEVREMPRDECIIFKSNCKPILAKKIVYHTDPVFKARLLPAPVVAPMDMDLHHAITEGRMRPAAPGEAAAAVGTSLAINGRAIAALSGDLDDTTMPIQDAAAVVDSFLAQVTLARVERGARSEDERNPTPIDDARPEPPAADEEYQDLSPMDI